jgi:DNA-binding GntR family transcriptional regulator
MVRAKTKRSRVVALKTKSESGTQPSTTRVDDQTAEPAPQSPLRQQAYERIRFEIVTFGLKPGDVVSETQLVKRFDVGIAAVRAALIRLAQDGLVIPRRRHGHMIAPITVQDIKEITFLRSCLEPAAAELATGRIDLALLRSLDRKSSAAVRTNDPRSEARSLMGNRDFHIAIAAASGNSRLLALIQQLHDLSFRFQYLLRHTEIPGDPWSSSHAEIIAAFEAGDPARVRKVMLEHIEESKDMAMKVLLNRPEIQGATVVAGK